MLNLIRKHMKVLKTGNLFFSFFTMGMMLSIFGPCLLDLQDIVHTDTQHIGLIISAKSIGFLIGSVLGGVILDLTPYKQAVLAVCNIFEAVPLFWIPWNQSVPFLIVLMAVNGLAGGVIITAGNVLCLQLWGKDSVPFLQTLHFVFGVGGFVSPLIAAPFLSNNNEISETSDNSTFLRDSDYSSVANFSNNISNTTDALENHPRIIYPFSILGAIALLVSILHLLVCVISPTEEDLREKKDENSDRSFLFSCFVAVFIFLVFFAVGGIELGYSHSLTTYAVKGALHATEEVGSYMTSAFWVGYTVSRLASVFLSAKISNQILLVIDICIMLIAALILLFLMPNEWALWLATVLFGVGISPCFGSLVGWLDANITLTNKISSVFSVGIAVSEMLVPFVVTYFIDALPDLLSYVIATLCIQMTVSLLVLTCIFQYGKKKVYDISYGRSATDSAEKYIENQTKY